MAVMVIAGGIGSVYLDRHWNLDNFHLFAYTSAEGARSLLSVISGSLITVASVAFSMTLLAISHVSSQYGPRIFTNLMRNRGNQFTLGIFTSTFIYSLLILRTVRAESADEYGGFVPHISIFIAFLLSILCIGTLIYFFHHVPESMRLSVIVRDLGQEFKSQIKEIYKDEFVPQIPEPETKPVFIQSGYSDPSVFYSIIAEQDGYLQSIDCKELVDLATKANIEVHLEVNVGDFVSEGRVLAQVAPIERVKKQLTQHLREKLSFGSARTSVQDFLFPAEQLVEIATHALSPGINEPTTAMMCMDWLQAGLCELSRRKVTPSQLLDQNQTLRLTMPMQIGFEMTVSRTMGNLLQYVIPDIQASRHFLKVLKYISEIVKSPEQRTILNHLSAELRKRFETHHGSVDYLQDGYFSC
jgi:uncharacterized membrane protein